MYIQLQHRRNKGHPKTRLHYIELSECVWKRERGAYPPSHQNNINGRSTSLFKQITFAAAAAAVSVTCLQPTTTKVGWLLMSRGFSDSIYVVVVSYVDEPLYRVIIEYPSLVIILQIFAHLLRTLCTVSVVLLLLTSVPQFNTTEPRVLCYNNGGIPLSEIVNKQYGVFFYPCGYWRHPHYSQFAYHLINSFTARRLYLAISKNQRLELFTLLFSFSFSSLPPYLFFLPALLLLLWPAKL